MDNFCSKIFCGALSAALQVSRRTGNIFTRRYKQPKETNYRQIEKDILDEVMGPKVSHPKRWTGVKREVCFTIGCISIYAR